MSPEPMPRNAQQCLILAHADIGYSARVSRQFRRLGWDVYLTRTGAEARRLACLLNPAVMVLATELEEESGWLLCDKLTRERPSPKVILIARELTPEQARLASFVGASGLVLEQDGVDALIDEVQGVALPVAG